MENPLVIPLCDLARNIDVVSGAYTPANVPGMPEGFHIYKKRLGGGLRQGVDVVEIHNGRCKVAVLPTRGMGVWKAWQDDVEFGWQSPVQGPVHPAFVGLGESNGLGWLDGFDELIVRCGLESNGGPVYDEQGKLVHPLHGRIANKPAHKVELLIDAEAGEVALRGEVDESRLYHNKLRLISTLRMRGGEEGFRVEDQVLNLSQEPGELALLYHVNFGAPVLDEGASVRAPARAVVPRNERAAEGSRAWDVYGPPQPGFTEQCYACELQAGGDGRTQVLLRNAHGHRGASLRYPLDQLPCFTIWKSTQSLADGYVTGLEPAINYPNPRHFEVEQRRIVKLSPGERRTFELEMQLHTTADAVAQAEEAVRRLQGSTSTVVHHQTQAPWMVG